MKYGSICARTRLTQVQIKAFLTNTQSFAHGDGEQPSDAFRFAAGKEKNFWMRRLSVALQKGNAMTFDAYCEWRNTRDLRVHGQAGFIAKRKQQRRPRLRARRSIPV
jgi:hypothetical protein